MAQGLRVLLVEDSKVLTERLTEAIRQIPDVELIGTAGDVFLLGSSGTGGMEAALVNVLSPGDAVLVVENGQFGERFTSIAGQLPVTVERMIVPWGEAPDADEIAVDQRGPATQVERHDC